jgi:hypothetical protein
MVLDGLGNRHDDGIVLIRMDHTEVSVRLPW